MVRAALSCSTRSPCCASSARIVAMSARSGAFSSTSGPSESRAAVISGSVAFFAPLIGMTPCSGLPPRMRMRSIVLQLRQRDAALAHVFSLAVRVADLGRALALQEQELADALVRVDAG